MNKFKKNETFKISVCVIEMAHWDQYSILEKNILFSFMVFISKGKLKYTTSSKIPKISLEYLINKTRVKIWLMIELIMIFQM